MRYRDIVVVGASAGGVEALRGLVRGLPVNFPGAIFIVLHIWPESHSFLPEILSAAGPLQAVHPNDGDRIKPRLIYVARPDLHLKLDPGRIRVVRGPKENRHRPAVDPLFRSAALAYASRVVGVVLSGSQDDGTAGLIAIKQAGGFSIVQNPEEAQYDGMPRNALRNAPVDEVLASHEIGRRLGSLVRTEAPWAPAPPPPRFLMKNRRVKIGLR